MSTETKTKTKKPRLTWRNEPKGGGLASIGRGPRGASLFVNGERVADVNAIGGGALNGPFRGWMWLSPNSLRFGITWRNTTAEPGMPYTNVDDAKAACEAYVRECLAKAPAGGAP